MNHLLKCAAQIKMLILDVDGVLTDGRLYILPNGEEMKAFHSLDGHGIKMLMNHNIKVAIITGRDAPSVAYRVQQLGIPYYFCGISDKKSAFLQLLEKTQIGAHECAYMGDDLPDLPVMREVLLAFAPANAHSEILEKVDWVTQKSGGLGAVREVCDLILSTHQTDNQDYHA